MRQRRACVHYFRVACSGLLLAGCPGGGRPVLVTSRDAISFGNSGTVATFTIRNAGTGTLDWTVREVARAANDAPWVPQDISWLEVDPTQGATSGEMDRVELRASREGLPTGTYLNSGVEVRSNGGNQIIPVSLIASPTLSVSPTRVPLAPTATSGQFSITNTGSETAQWTVGFLTDPNNTENVLPIPETIQVQPNPGSTGPGATTNVTVTFASGQTDFHLIVQSDRGSSVVSFVFGAVLEGLEATPSPLVLFVNSPGEGEPGVSIASPLTITNSSGISRSWTLEAVSRLDSSATPPIAIAPSTGTTAANSSSEVEVRVSDVENVEPGSGFYDLVLRSGENFILIPVVVEITPLPEITLSEPPQDTAQRPEVAPIDFLDFGREQVQGVFYIVNTGPRGSNLYFRITYEGQDEENPLIASVVPLSGDTNGPEEIFFWPPEGNLMVDAQPVTVIVDRSAMTETIEERVITVTAYDADLQEPLAIVEPVELSIRVERPPLKVQGAINRGRPPFVDRWVLLLRDDLGNVIPTRTQEDLDRIQIRVTENDFDIDLDETNQFIDGPEALKVNLVVLLDLTGSMYRAGTTDTDDPLAPGEALAQVKEATKDFLDDLPENWQVSLMYYNDRQQRNRLMAPFTTDREALKDALDAFTLPVSQYGLSAIYDALEDAVERLVAEDPAETLPFDDADVRAIVFISDGKDTGSLITQSDAITLAQDNRVQLYPLGYSAGGLTRTGDLLVMAEETGGFAYNAGNVRNLRLLLGNERGFGLAPAATTSESSVFFEVKNVGENPLSWTASIEQGIGWITGVSPASNTVPVGGSTLVRVNVNAAAAPAGRIVEGNILFNSSNGTGTATVRLRTNQDGSIAALTVALEDEPGTVWKELRNQMVFSYITPLQDAGEYQLHVRYTKPDGQNINGQFEEDGIFFPGDVFAGQLALRTSGILENPRATGAEEPVTADVFVRAEYMPRGVNRFRLRFFTEIPQDAPLGAQAAMNDVEMNVELAPDGLLVPQDPFAPDWRLVEEADGIYVMLTEEENPLPYGAFGNLLRIRFLNLEPYLDLFASAGRDAEFLVHMRVDNDIYYAPETPGRPSQTKYFLYPGGPTAPGRSLLVSERRGDLAPPALGAVLLQNPGVDPEAPGAFDRDEDGLSDFQDPQPDVAEQPGTLVQPQRIEIDVNRDSGTLVLRNNRLDTFTWSLDPASVPAWLTVTPEGAQPLTTLSPGQAQVLTVSTDRAGLPDGFNTANLRFQFDVFPDQVVPVVVIVAQQ